MSSWSSMYFPFFWDDGASPDTKLILALKCTYPSLRTIGASPDTEWVLALTADDIISKNWKKDLH